MGVPGSTQRLGRRLGSGTWADEAHFRSAVAAAVAGLRGQGRPPTERNVADFLCHSPDQDHPRCSDRQLRRWCLEQFGYASWESFLATLG